MPSGESSERKAAYFTRVKKLVSDYSQALIVEVDNVSASHLSTVRKILRQYNASILMGKNSLIRKALRDFAATNPKVEAIIPLLVGNIGIIFCRGHLKEVVDVLDKERVAAPAKIGSIAPVDVIVPAGNTGLEPTQTGFLQALNIQTKIAKGQIEILKDVRLLTIGQKVGSSEAALLTKLNIKPFTYGLNIKTVYDDGKTYSAAVLKLTEQDIMTKFIQGATRVACLSLAIGWPSLASLPHALFNGYKNVLAVSLGVDFDIEQTRAIKALLADPEALKRATAGAASTGGATKGPAVAAKVEEKPEEPEEEAQVFDLFG